MTLESAIYIAYREVEKDSDNWRPEIDCEPVDVALIAAVAGGSALGKYHYNCSDFYFCWHSDQRSYGLETMGKTKN